MHSNALVPALVRPPVLALSQWLAWAWTIAFGYWVMLPYEARNLEPTAWTDAAAALGVVLWLWAGGCTLSALANRRATGAASASFWLGTLALLCSSGLYFVTFNVPGAWPSLRFKELAGFETWAVSRADQGVRYAGPITPGGVAQLKRTLRPGDDYLSIDSPGGIVGPGFELADLVKGIGLRVEVDRICASACTLAFFAADERAVAPQARIGVHRISALDSAQADPVQLARVGRLADAVIVDGGFPPEYLDFAFERGAQAMHWMGARELIQRGLARPL